MQGPAIFDAPLIDLPDTGSVGAEIDPVAVLRPARANVIGPFACELLWLAAFSTYSMDVGLAIAAAVKGDARRVTSLANLPVSCRKRSVAPGFFLGYRRSIFRSSPTGRTRQSHPVGVRHATVVVGVRILGVEVQGQIEVGNGTIPFPLLGPGMSAVDIRRSCGCPCT